MDNDVEAYQIAKQNAEKILERNLTETEIQVLILGILHGKQAGKIEGAEQAMDFMREKTLTTLKTYNNRFKEIMDL